MEKGGPLGAPGLVWLLLSSSASTPSSWWPDSFLHGNLLQPKKEVPLTRRGDGFLQAADRAVAEAWPRIERRRDSVERWLISREQRGSRCGGISIQKRYSYSSSFLRTHVEWILFDRGIPSSYGSRAAGWPVDQDYKPRASTYMNTHVLYLDFVHVSGRHIHISCHVHAYEYETHELASFLSFSCFFSPSCLEIWHTWSILTYIAHMVVQNLIKQSYLGGKRRGVCTPAKQHGKDICTHPS